MEPPVGPVAQDALCRGHAEACRGLLQALIRKYMPIAVVLGFLLLLLWARSYFWGRR